MKARLLGLTALLVLLTAGTGALSVIDSRRQGEIFRESRDLFAVHQGFQEVKDLLHRHNRAILSYALLLEEAEKLQILQTQEAIARRLERWQGWVAKGWADPADFAAVRDASEKISFTRFQVLSLMEQGLRQAALAKVEREFLPDSSRMGEAVGAANARLDRRHRALAEELSARSLRGQKVFAGAALLALLFGIVMARNLRSSMVLSVLPPVSRAVKPPIFRRGYRGSSVFEKTGREIPPPPSVKTPLN